MTVLPREASVPIEADDFDQWVRPHVLAMTRLAARLAGDAAADDVVQDALVRAWRKRGTFDPARGSVGPWLLAITADRARRFRRRLVATVPLADAAGVSPELERRMDVERAVASLGRKQRLAVELYYFLGLSVAETAAVLDCSEGTVKSQLSDARAALRRDLGGSDVE